MLQSVILFIFCIFLFPLSSLSNSDSFAIPAVQPVMDEVWPAGTHLLIPDRVMRSYHEESDSWSDPSVYLMANYFLTASSFRDKRKETVYIPLVNGKTGEEEQKEALVDMMEVRRVKDNDSAFITIHELHILVIKTDGENLYIGARLDN